MLELVTKHSLAPSASGAAASQVIAPSCLQPHELWRFPVRLQDTLLLLA